MEFYASADVGAKSKETLGKWMAAADTDQTSFGDQFPNCPIETTADKEMSKKRVGIRHPEGRAVVIAVMGQLSARHLLGAAPPGHLEDEIPDWIAYLEKRK